MEGENGGEDDHCVGDLVRQVLSNEHRPHRYLQVPVDGGLVKQVRVQYLAESSDEDGEEAARLTRMKDQCREELNQLLVDDHARELLEMGMNFVDQERRHQLTKAQWKYCERVLGHSMTEVTYQRFMEELEEPMSNENTDYDWGAFRTQQ